MLVGHEDHRMFLRRYTRTKEGKQHVYYALVESIRTDDDPDAVHIRLGKVGWTNARRFSDVWLAQWLWQHLGPGRPARRTRRRRRQGSPESLRRKLDRRLPATPGRASRARGQAGPARPGAFRLLARSLSALHLQLPERLSSDRLL
jgi:hypothetical protein